MRAQCFSSPIIRRWDGRALVRQGHLEQIDKLFTDKPLPPEMKETIAARGRRIRRIGNHLAGPYILRQASVATE
ncbi:protein of unknown function (plasmid) [Caballeronia sp. S22]